ncbi:protein kinase [Jatrophihabitans sp.]|uniref:protein kinase domain-containing protein n=1 Tax=Jatrophihabitans sp. TaxID=1932789 RepID=UPI0030C6E7A5|nr:Serine/threonine protein kinase [Jatrophihabitans sp.]
MTGGRPRVRGYRVEELLGTGGSAQVWRARSCRTGELVALRLLPSERAAEGRAEAARLQTVDHPNLIGVHELVTTRGGLVQVLDHAAGGTLAELVGRRRAITAGELIAALVPVASALAALHAAGFVHGDVTPANVLFSADGLPLLADLGVGPSSRPARAFADPVAEQGWYTGAAGDVYGLGAVAFFAALGRPPPLPLAAPTPRAVDEHAAQLRAALSSLPGAVADVVARGLSLDPGSRGSALQWALDLRFAGPASGVDLRAGRHSQPVPLPVITRGARLPATASVDRSRSRRLRPRSGPRDTPPRRHVR